MKSISELSKLEGRVYVYLSSPEICKQFFEDAEAEGFTFGDGKKPSQKQTANIIALNSNGTLNYVGANGRIAYGSGAKKVGEKMIIRIDYERYVSNNK